MAIKKHHCIVQYKAKERVMLCAHWDSRPFADKDKEEANHTKPCPGVNDGASGVDGIQQTDASANAVLAGDRRLDHKR